MLLSRWPAFAAGVFAVLCWSCLPVAMKLGMKDLPLTYFLFLRFAISTAFCLSITRIDFKRCEGLPLSCWAILSAILAANFILQAFAIQEIPATWYIAIFSLSPLISLIGVRARLTSVSTLGIALAFVGTSVFSIFSDQLTSLSWKGLLALLAGMITWALYVPAVRPFQDRFSDRQVMAITSCLSLLPVSFLWIVQGAPVAPLSFHGYATVVALGFLVPLAYWSFLYSVRLAPVFGISIQYLEPVFGFAFAVFALGEALTHPQLLGGLAILAGIALIRPE